MQRSCPGCSGVLECTGSEEEEGRDRGGNARTRTSYRCTSCGQRYRHTYWESFSADRQAWVRVEGEKLVELAESDYPKWVG